MGRCETALLAVSSANASAAISFEAGSDVKMSSRPTSFFVV